MLILSRKVNESIVIDGKIVVKVLRIERDAVKLGIQAPPEVPVHREEIYLAIQRNHKNAKSNGGLQSANTSSEPPPPGGEDKPPPPRR